LPAARARPAAAPEAEEPTQGAHEVRQKVLIGVAVGLAAIAGVWLVSRHNAEDGVIRLSGNVELVDVEVSFKQPGWVASRPVDEGYVVQKGQLVATLDTDELAKQIAEARAQVALAESQLAELEAGTRKQDIELARAEVERAEAEERAALFDVRRQESLERVNAAAAAERVHTEAAYDRATAALKAAKANLSLALEGPRREHIDQARARLEQARANLGWLEVRRKDADLVSPIEGVVLSKHVEPGEYVAPGTAVVTIGDLRHVWLRAYLDEADLGRVRPGQPVRVRTDTYPDKVYQGTLSFIADQAEFTPKNVQTPKQRVKLVYRVKIDIDNPNMELKAGMPADAEIRPMEASGSAYGSDSD
jgi:HlyD family secretion protein